MTPEEKRALDALNNVSMRIASSGKRFRRDLCWRLERDPEYKLTARQALYLWFFVDMYRRQVRDEELKRYAAHRRLTGELPPIYLEGDHRILPSRKKVAKQITTPVEATVNRAADSESARTVGTQPADLQASLF